MGIVILKRWNFFQEIIFNFKMKRYIRFSYKLVCYVTVLLTSKLYTWVFRCKLWINNVEFEKGIITFNAIPDLLINRNSKLVRVGKDVKFNNYTDQSWYCKCKLMVRKDAEFVIGDYSGMNGTLIYCAEKIIIGNYVNIGGGTRIYDTNFHNLDYLKRRDPKTNLVAKTSPIIIEDDVFIGTNCIIGKGVTIGARTIVAAGSVVVKSIPADCVAGGNPCKIIRNN